MKILTLSGSIREDSSNAALLSAVSKLFPQMEWQNFPIKTLPFFDPQLQFGDDIPKAVLRLRSDAKAANFLVIATPEYAHGIPGILKNALEWLVCEETMQKKVIVFVATASGGEYVKEYLLETLRTMDMIASEQMTMTVLGARKNISAEGQILDAELKSQIHAFLQNIWGS
jgi:NAD(P)H-dependent FMN reductase